MTAVATALIIVGAVLLLAIATLHASGLAALTNAVAATELSPLYKAALPALWLYPSGAMVTLALYALVLLRNTAPRSGLVFVAVAALANSVLGFVLGGVLPGLVMMIAGLAVGAAALTTAPVADGC